LGQADGGEKKWKDGESSAHRAGFDSNGSPGEEGVSSCEWRSLLRRSDREIKWHRVVIVQDLLPFQISPAMKPKSASIRLLLCAQ
jgi:hypothetical protein